MYGLKQQDIDLINGVFSSFSEVETVILYGSRAKGTFKLSSDIDFVLKGEKLNVTILNKISWLLDDLLLPYTIDISIFHQLDNQDLINHIERVGIVFSKKN